MLRRNLLKAGVATAGAMLVPRTVIGAYPVDAFLAKQPADALREVLGTADIAPGDAIEIDAPPIASDPDLVTVRVRSGYAGTESITIVASGNESPLAAHYRLYGGQHAVTTRLRLDETGELLVVVKADGQLHAASRQLRVANFCRA
ncbi:MAG: thiosulfate oxidation carrier protein SoxY [Gammaproteobacteria bacterium]|nr:thiosulfate oxidation carrier protein SoxY [Gammaproteobacteria bacterium]